MTNEKKTPLSGARGARAQKVLTALCKDTLEGRRLHAELRMEARAADAHQAREELALLHELMRALRDDALQAVANMRAAAGFPLH